MNARSQNVPAIVCRECGAYNTATVKNCWLCKSDHLQPSDIIMAELVPQYSASRNNPAIFPLVSLFAIVTLVSVGLGVFLIEPGLGIMFVIVTVPSLIATVIHIQIRNAKHDHGGWKENILKFCVSMVAAIGLLILLAVAAAAVLFVMCLAVVDQIL